jgi:hypothetical protein
MAQFVANRCHVPYWVDPKEALVGVLMTQYMVGFDAPEKDFQVLAYQALGAQSGRWASVPS